MAESTRSTQGARSSITGRAERPRWLHRMVLMLLGAFLVSSAGALRAQPKPKQSVRAERPVQQAQVLCGHDGQACCKDLDRAGAVVGLPNCDTGFGCDVQANRCVAACGGRGQPCCDGPDTMAPRGGASPMVQLVSKRPMCSTGSCSKETHRCSTCGQLSGQACCQADAQRAVPTCPVEGLYCRTTDADESKGVCDQCGHAGEVPCPGERCGSQLLAIDGVCVACGRIGLRVCSGQVCAVGAPDPFEQGPVQTCVACGALGQPACDFKTCREGQAYPGMALCASSARCGNYAAAVATTRRAISKGCMNGNGPFQTVGDPAAPDRWCQSSTDQSLAADLQARRRYLGMCPVCNRYAQEMASSIQNQNMCFKTRAQVTTIEYFQTCMRAAPAELSGYATYRDRFVCPAPSGSSGDGSGQHCCMRCVGAPAQVPGGSNGFPGPPACQVQQVCYGCP